MTITNLNPDTDIGASAWLVDFEGHRLLLDAGMHPKREGREGCPASMPLGARRWTPSRFRTAITITSARCRWRCGTFPGRT